MCPHSLSSGRRAKATDPARTLKKGGDRSRIGDQYVEINIERLLHDLRGDKNHPPRTVPVCGTKEVEQSPGTITPHTVRHP